MRALRIIALLVACAGVAGSAAAAGGASKEPIIIGLAIDQTGFGATYDNPGAAGVEMVVADTNRRGGLLGRPLRTVYSDAKSTVDGSAVAGQAVVGKGADFVISTCDYDFGGPAARVANAKKIVAFSMCAADPKFGVQGIGRYAFTPSWGTPTEAAAMAEFAYEKGFRKPFLLIDTLVNYSKTLCGYFEERWTQLAGKGAIAGKDTFSNMDASIQSQVTRVRSTSSADSVILCSFNPGGAAATKQLRGGGVDLPIVAGDGMDGDFWQKAIPNLKDFWLVTGASIFGDDPRPAINRFVQRYKKKVGKAPPTAFSVMGYSIAQAIVRAVQRAKTTGGPAVVKQLERFRGEPLLQGPTTFTPTYHFNYGATMTVLEVRGARPHFVKLLKPKKVPKPRF